MQYSNDSSLICNTCSKSFVAGQAVLTSVSCGHTFHSSEDCVEELEATSKYDTVEVYSGGCRVPGCKYDGATIANSSEAYPTTLLFRNLPLEGVIAKPQQQESSVRSNGTQVGKLGQDQLIRPSKRIKLSGDPIVEPTEVHNDNLQDEFLRPRNPSSYSSLPLDVAPLPPSEDSDPEEEEAQMQFLAAASQRLQRARYELPDKIVEDSEDARTDGEALSTTASEAEEEEMHHTSEDEPLPLDEYGMPPLSQWRRSTMA